MSTSLLTPPHSAHTRHPMHGRARISFIRRPVEAGSDLIATESVRGQSLACARKLVVRRLSFTAELGALCPCNTCCRFQVDDSSSFCSVLSPRMDKVTYCTQ